MLFGREKSQKREQSQNREKSLVREHQQTRDKSYNLGKQQANEQSQTQQTSQGEMLMVVGLGNPGAEYQETRHNCGFMVVDLLAEKYDGRWAKTKFKALTARIIINGRRILLVKPQTFMNNSGEAVALLQNFYRTKTEDIIIIYDDVDIQLGQVRIREHGGPGSHNGMKSVTCSIGQNFPRIRVGIGPQPEHYDIIDFVLGRFSPAEKEVLGSSLAKAAQSIELTTEGGIQFAMNHLNQRSGQNTTDQRTGQNTTDLRSKQPGAHGVTSGGADDIAGEDANGAASEDVAGEDAAGEDAAGEGTASNDATGDTQ